MPRYFRDFRLQIGRAGQQGWEVVPPLRITFEVQKDTDEDPNFHTVRVYNLTHDRRREFEEKDLRLRLYAGYRDEDGPVLCAAGTIVDAYSYHDGPEVVTELRVADGYAEIRDTAVSLGYSAGVSSATILRDIAKQMGLPLNLGQDVPERTWSNGFSYYGAARTALHKVTAGAGAQWSVQNNELQVIANGGVTRRQGFVISADSGLIGYPQRTHENAREKAKVTDKTTGKDVRLVSAKQQRYGYKVTSLLLPTVVPGDLVKLESFGVDGWYRVEGLTHNGDSEGGDWQTEMQLVERNAPPKNDKRKKK